MTIPRDRYGIIHSTQWNAARGRRDLFGHHLNASGACICRWRCCVKIGEGGVREAICVCRECVGCVEGGCLARGARKNEDPTLHPEEVRGYGGLTTDRTTDTKEPRSR